MILNSFGWHVHEQQCGANVRRANTIFITQHHLTLFNGLAKRVQHAIYIIQQHVTTGHPSSL